MGYPRYGASQAYCASAPRGQRRTSLGGGPRVASYIALNYWGLVAASIFIFIQCHPFDDIWAKSSSQPAGRGNPHGGAADTSGPGVDDAFFGRLAAVDRDRCVCDGAVCRTRSSTTTRAAALRLVVLRVGHRLYDDVVGSGDGLRLIGRAAPKCLVRPTLCDTAARHDFGQLYDRRWLGSQYLDDEPCQPPCQSKPSSCSAPPERPLRLQ